MKLKIIDMDHAGNGIGKVDNKVIFVPKSITGDVCDIDNYKCYNKYDIGRINKIVTPSIDRIDAKCPYYQVCGGCNICNLDYQKQLEFKQNKVKNIFKKYLNMEINPQIIPSEKIDKYRNKITYHIMNNDIGLIGEFDDFIKIDRCFLVSDKINDLYNEINKLDLSDVRLITIKECDNGLILNIDGKIKFDTLKNKCLSIYMNNKCVYKKENGYIMIDNLKFMISNNSFFQINTSNINNLYKQILKYGCFSMEDRVIDLYCGVGSITLYLARYVKSILGIEIIPEAIDDAKKNAVINNIDNAEFICKDISKYNLDDIEGDILIVDPPRIGMDKKTRNSINQRKFKKIIYVSCDPMTLVRDIKKMNNYNVQDIILIDMFPQTHHCESVCVLERR